MIKNALKNEQGNAFFVIMVGVVLFAALIFTFTKTSQNTTNNISKSEAKIASTEILTEAKKIETATIKLLRNNCSENDISFENIFIEEYKHTPDTQDECKIFNQSGGRINYFTPPDNWLDFQHKKSPQYKEWYITSNTCIWETEDTECSPNDENELMLIIPYVKIDICENIIKNIGIYKTTPTNNKDPFQFDNHFTGDYGKTSQFAIETYKSKTGCVKTKGSSSTSSYHFYHVLINR